MGCIYLTFHLLKCFPIAWTVVFLCRLNTKPQKERQLITRLLGSINKFSIFIDDQQILYLYLLTIHNDHGFSWSFRANISCNSGCGRISIHFILHDERLHHLFACLQIVLLGGGGEVKLLPLPECTQNVTYLHTLSLFGYVWIRSRWISTTGLAMAFNG